MTDHAPKRSTNDRGERAPLQPEQFAEYVELLLTNHDEIEVQGREQLALQLAVGDRERAIDLTPFYQAYTRNPSQLDAVVRTLLHVLLDELPNRAEREFAALADRIYPMLKPIELLVTVRERNLPMLVYREFLGVLIIAYVIDEGQSVAYINEDHVERWGVSGLEIHEKAIENLRRRTMEQIKYITTGEAERQIFIYNSGDGYDASRLLLTETLASWARALPGNIVIGIPNRDFLIAFSDADDEVLRAVAVQIQTDAAKDANGLTDQLFTLKGDQIRAYEGE